MKHLVNEEGGLLKFDCCLLCSVFCVFYFRSVSSCSASSSDDCTKLVGESHPDSYLRFCVCSTNNAKDCKYVW